MIVFDLELGVCCLGVIKLNDECYCTQIKCVSGLVYRVTLCVSGVTGLLIECTEK